MPQRRSILRAVLVGLPAGLLTLFALAACEMNAATSDAPRSGGAPSPWRMFGLAATAGTAVALWSARERRHR